VPVHVSKTVTATRTFSARDNERSVRDILARKACGSLFGLWLLSAEFRILGTWERLVRWTRRPPEAVEPRLALQLVNEAALCSTGIRARQRMCNKGFELANGLPWVATDTAIHDLLDAHTAHDACAYQVELGRIRRACGHLPLRLVVIDPHRIPSSTIRRMVKAVPSPGAAPTPVANVFFALDADSKQPVAFMAHTSDQTTSQATPGLIQLIHDIAPDAFIHTVADAEHCSRSLISHFAADPYAALLTPLPLTKAMLRFCRAIPATDFVQVCAGFAYALGSYSSRAFGPVRVLVQRLGMHQDDFVFKPFALSDDPGDRPLALLVCDFPDRWHVEEFFRHDGHIAWNRAATHNLNIRFNHMALALDAQAALHQFRQRIPAPFSSWDAPALSHRLLAALDGDVRVCRDTILVTLYNAPFDSPTTDFYRNLPSALSRSNVDPRIPWLFNFKLAFRFK